MPLISDPAITADTTKVTADTTVNRPVFRMLGRLRAILAPWFGDDAPILDGVLTGIAALLTFVRSFIVYARLQTRVGTSTGLFLDLTASDFFGPRIQRRAAEPDGDYSLRIRREVLRPRVTRAAIAQAVTDLTGIAPDIVEPWNPGDCGAYDVGTFAYAGDAGDRPALSGYDEAFGAYDIGAIAYDTPFGTGVAVPGAGCWGSLEMPCQFFVTVHRPSAVFAGLAGCGAYDEGGFAYGGGSDGVPAVSGYDDSEAGYDVGDGSYGIPPGPYGRFTGAGYYVDEAEQVSITDEEIYATIADATAAGVIAWTRIRGA